MEMADSVPNKRRRTGHSGGRGDISANLETPHPPNKSQNGNPVGIRHKFRAGSSVPKRQARQLPSQPHERDYFRHASVSPPPLEDTINVATPQAPRPTAHESPSMHQNVLPINPTAKRGRGRPRKLKVPTLEAHLIHVFDNDGKPEDEQKSTRSQRKRKVKTYNLKELGDQAYGEELRERSISPQAKEAKNDRPQRVESPLLDVQEVQLEQETSGRVVHEPDVRMVSRRVEVQPSSGKPAFVDLTRSISEEPLRRATPRDPPNADAEEDEDSRRLRNLVNVDEDETDDDGNETAQFDVKSNLLRYHFWRIPAELLPRHPCLVGTNINERTVAFQSPDGSVFISHDPRLSPANFEAFEYEDSGEEELDESQEDISEEIDDENAEDIDDDNAEETVVPSKQFDLEDSEYRPVADEDVNSELEKVVWDDSEDENWDAREVYEVGAVSFMDLRQLYDNFSQG